MRIFAWVVLMLPHFSFGDLRVFPTRLFLSDTKRVADISLKHVGNTPMTYKISLVYYRMKTDGTLELSTTPDTEPRSAVKMFRFSPRQVTLSPNVEQVVRVMYAGGKSLEDGDYRAHIHFEPTEVEPPDTGEKAAKDEGKPKMTMKLQARIAVAVPVVFRHGNASFEAKLSNLKLTQLPDKSIAYEVDLESQGNAFAFGDIEALFTPKGKDRAIQVGLVKSLSNYLSKRKVIYTLAPPKDLQLKKGTLRLEYRTPEDDGSKLLASTELEVN